MLGISSPQREVSLRSNPEAALPIFPQTIVFVPERLRLQYPMHQSVG